MNDSQSVKVIFEHAYEIVTPTFLLDKYGKYKIVNKEVQSDE